MIIVYVTCKTQPVFFFCGVTGDLHFRFKVLIS